MPVASIGSETASRHRPCKLSSGRCMVRTMRARERHSPVTVEDEIAHLRGLDLKGLRARWAGAVRKAAPAHLPRHLLLGILAYRLQVGALGDLDAGSLRLLSQIGAGRADAEQARLTADFHLRRAELKPGTILTREWNGHPHRVMVVDAGFAWMGKTYDSLSKVAFAITGTKWNGPRFFGLRDQQPERMP